MRLRQPAFIRANVRPWPGSEKRPGQCPDAVLPSVGLELGEPCSKIAAALLKAPRAFAGLPVHRVLAAPVRAGPHRVSVLPGCDVRAKVGHRRVELARRRSSVMASGDLPANAPEQRSREVPDDG